MILAPAGDVSTWITPLPGAIPTPAAFPVLPPAPRPPMSQTPTAISNTRSAAPPNSHSLEAPPRGRSSSSVSNGSLGSAGERDPGPGMRGGCEREASGVGGLYGGTDPGRLGGFDPGRNGGFETGRNGGFEDGLVLTGGLAGGDVEDDGVGSPIVFSFTGGR